MTSWKPCTSAPDVGDTVRWKEPLWGEPTQKRGKRDAIGEQAVTAKVLAQGELMQLEVVEAKILSHTTPEKPELKLKAGDKIQRKVSSLERGNCELQQ